MNFEISYNDIKNKALLPKMDINNGILLLKDIPDFKYFFESIHKEIEKFFALDIDIKNTVGRNKKTELRGYFPFDKEKKVYKEGFEIGRDFFDIKNLTADIPIYQNNQWSITNKLIEFKKQSESYFNFMQNLAEDIFFYIIRTVFNSRVKISFDKPLSTLRYLHYPKMDLNFELVQEAHKDELCCLTLLASNDFDGFDVYNTNTKKWHLVSPPKNSIVVLFGGIMELLTGQKSIAPLHRVRNMGKERYSIPFFLEPNMGFKFKFFEGNDSITYGRYVLEKLKQRKAWSNLEIPTWL